MKKSAPKKVNKAKSSSWLPVGITVMILLFALAYAMHKNQNDEREYRSKSERIINKIEQTRDVKNAFKRLVK